ncbi:MAG: ATP-binding protein, partial [Undibacterium sp.]|nr:ATP-binding protein [Undibacterium sp.]
SEVSLRHSELKFSEIFQRSPEALSLVNIDLRRVDAVNDAFAKLFGYQTHEMLGLITDYQVQLWVDESNRQAFVAQLRRDFYVDRFEARLRRSDGSVIVCLISAQKYEAGDGLHNTYIMSQQDVTQQRAIEQQIRELNAQLEQRVSSRTHRLEQSNAELAEALTSLKKMQSELIRSEKLASLGSLVAGIAHELNTPIGNAVTIASTMQDEARRLQSDVQDGKLKRASFDRFLSQLSFGTDVLLRSLVRAGDLIRSFKNVAVDQSSDMRRQFDLRQMLDEIVLTNAPLFRKTAYAMEADIDEGIVMDSFPGALGQVVTNLIVNSVTHGFDGRNDGKMRMKASRAMGDTVVISFEDDGVGISEANLKKVFDPFFTTKFGQGGSGLGMHIVYNLVTEVLGGSIDIV